MQKNLLKKFTKANIIMFLLGVQKKSLDTHSDMHRQQGGTQMICENESTQYYSV